MQNHDQRQIAIVNTGIIVANALQLRHWLDRISNDNTQNEFYLTDIFAMASVQGYPAKAVIVDNPVEAEGANDLWQLARLERAFQQRAVQELCMKGVRFADPARVDLRGNVQVGHDVAIDIDVILEGDVTLADGVRIGPFCRLRNVSLAPGSVVDAHCDLRGVRSEGAVRIGPFARLRPETLLADGACVGNFVETKNTHIGVNSKANHLTYLGDAVLGAGVNIGAGTITCNYDGANKSITRIDDDAFIGSNVSLVAPLVIGKQATIGAGSVISEDAEARVLTLSRSPQKIIKNWKRPEKKR